MDKIWRVEIIMKSKILDGMVCRTLSSIRFESKSDAEKYAKWLKNSKSIIKTCVIENKFAFR